MITVSISINAEPIYGRTAVNTGHQKEGGFMEYRLDDGSVIWYLPRHGAIALAKRMLDTIEEVRREGPNRSG